MKRLSLRNIVPKLFSANASRREQIHRLIREFNLDGKVDWNILQEHGQAVITPVRVVKDDSERGVPLPTEFISATGRILEKGYREAGFTVAHAEPKWMTLEEIRAEIHRWKVYCDWAWAGAGG